MPRRILGGGAKRLALLIVEDRSVEIDRSVPDENGETFSRRPGRFHQPDKDALADPAVAGGPSGALVERACRRAKQVGLGSRTPTSKSPSSTGTPFDAMVFHQARDLVEGRVRGLTQTRLQVMISSILWP